MKLRDYQLDAVESVESGWGDSQRQLGVAATGAGKTIMFSHLVQRQPGRSLILCHREELINQAVDKLHKATGIFASIEQADNRAMPGHGVIVASVQSMRRRLDKFGPDAFDLIICDEAHHVISDEWRQVLRYFSGCKRVLGVTATPDRGDRKSLGSYFQRIAFEVTMPDLIRQGYLCKLRAQALDITVDVRALAAKRVISADDTADLLHPIVDSIAKEASLQCWDRKMLTFLPRRDISIKFAAALCSYGIEARHVDGDSVNREEQLRWFAEPGPKALCNAMLLTEGYDQPDVDCILTLRPIKSRSLYTQIVGRGTRISPGKDYCLLLDPLWLTGTHSLCRPACLSDGDNDHQARVQKLLDLGMDLLEAEERAHTDAEEALAEKLKNAKRAKPPKGLVDPLAYALASHEPKLEFYSPTTEWEAEPVLDTQAATLAGAGIWTEGMTRGHAGAILKSIAARRNAGLATPKQIMLLNRMKVPSPGRLTFTEASQILSQLLTRR